MAAEVIETDPHDVLVTKIVEAVSQAIGGSLVPTRVLAEAFLRDGAAALVALDGREEAAGVLRTLADAIERPATYGQA